MVMTIIPDPYSVREETLEVWVNRVEEKYITPDCSSGSELSLWKQPSIYFVPGVIKYCQRSSVLFSPKIVSLGPYHHGQQGLEGILEGHKLRALTNVVKKSGKTLEMLTNEMKEVEQKLSEYYKVSPSWTRDSNKFLQMMLEDGSFMLEILRMADHNRNSDDTVFGVHGDLYHVIPFIKNDMLLVENQLPLLLLEKLRAFETGETDELENKQAIRILVLKFFNIDQPVDKYYSCPHVLDMRRKSLVEEEGARAANPTPKGVTTATTGRTLLSVEMLQNADIRFMPSPTRSLDDISFKDGVLSLPTVVIDENSESLFLNLMAFEWLYVRGENKVIYSYISILSMVTSAADVKILSSVGIIENNLRSDNEVVELYDSLSRNATLTLDDYNMNMLKEIDSCYKDRMNKWKRRLREWRSNLRQTYFKNPWTFISVLAAFILLVLTVIQTTYTVLSFYSQKNVSIKAFPPPKN